MFRFHGHAATYTTPLDDGERWPRASQTLRFETASGNHETDFTIRVYLDATTQPIFEKVPIGEPAGSITHGITS
jgi:hypothetical protein